MNTLLISRHHLLQVASVPVKRLASLQQFYSQDVGKQEYPAVKPFSAIPGPPSLPFLGTFWDYYRGKYNLQKPYETYSLFLEKYGPLVKEKVFLGQTLVHVFHPEDLEEVHRRESFLPIRHSHKALKEYRESRRDLYGHVGVAPSNQEEWNRYRNLFVDSALKFDRLPAAQCAVEEIADDLIKYMKSNLDQNGEISLFPALYYYTLEVVGIFVLGTRMGCFDQDRKDDVERFIQAVHDSHYAIYETEYTPYFLTKEARKTLEFSQDYMAHFVTEHMTRINELIEQERRKDLFDGREESEDLVISETESNSYRIPESLIYNKLKEGLSERMILPMAVDFFQGGIHSTAHSLAFAIYNLVQNPDKQEILREQLVKNFPNKSDIKDLTYILRKSRYARDAIQESLRLNPPTIGTGRVLSKDIVLRGYRVPKGTKVILHHEVACKHYFRDPLQFIPEREYNDVENAAFNPFMTTSRRMCMGISIAQFEMRMAVVKIFRHFEVSYHYKKVGVVNYLINEPAEPIVVRLKEVPDSVPRLDG